MRLGPLLALLLTLTACGGSDSPPGDVIYYRDQGPWLDRIIEQTYPLLPVELKFEKSDTKEDLRISIAPDGYFRGCAHVCSRRGWVTLNLDTPEDFEEKAIYSILHEVGHMLGAEHREETDAIMNHGVLYYRHLQPHWKEQSINEIRSCNA